MIEEIFPLSCSLEEADAFIDASRSHADGWISFYWGTTIDEYQKREDVTSAIMREWLLYFQKGREIIATRP